MNVNFKHDYDLKAMASSNSNKNILKLTDDKFFNSFIEAGRHTRCILKLIN